MRQTFSGTHPPSPLGPATMAESIRMHQHDHDESNAPDQAQDEKPTDPAAHLAHGVPGAQPPLEEEGAHDGRRHQTAAGLYAIYETAHFGLKEMGVKRTLQTLLTLNQKRGFDC